MTAPRYLTKALVGADADGISLTQTPSGAGNLLINGAFATAGVATLDTQRIVLFTFAADESARTFVVYGTDDNGRSIQETVAGTADTAETSQSFKTVTRISIDDGSAGAITVGTNGVGATPWQIINWDISPINLGIAVLVVGTVDYTWQYTFEDPSGVFPNPRVVSSGYVDTEQPSHQLVKFPTAFGLSALSSKSADTDASMTTPIVAWRLQINSGTGSAQCCIIQAGIAGN